MNRAEFIEMLGNGANCDKLGDVVDRVDLLDSLLHNFGYGD